MADNILHRAKQLFADGDLDYAIKLLIECCRNDPANIPIRMELRRIEVAKYNGNKRGKPLAFLTTWLSSVKLEKYCKTGEHLKVIEMAENILRDNPWHLRALTASANAFEKLGLIELALWSFDQARRIEPDDPVVNRQMAALFKKRGNFKNP